MKALKLAICLLISIVLTIFTCVYADEMSEVEEFVYESGDKSLLYRLYLPDDWQTTSYPVVLFMHGAGQRGDDNQQQLLDGIGPWLFWNGDIKQYPAIYIFPQVPSGQLWVNVAWTEGSYSVDEIPESDSNSLSYELTLKLADQYNADMDRLYITGMSMGAYGTWDMIVRHPGTFAAAIPVCGGGDPSKVSEIGKTPVWAFHGDRDTTVPYTGSSNMCAALEAAGGNVKLTTFEEYDHVIWDLVYGNPEVLDWMFSQTLDKSSESDAAVMKAEPEITTAAAEIDNIDTTAAVVEYEAPKNVNVDFGRLMIIVAVILLLTLVFVVLRFIKNQKSTR